MTNFMTPAQAALNVYDIPSSGVDISYQHLCPVSKNKLVSETSKRDHMKIKDYKYKKNVVSSLFIYL